MIISIEGPDRAGKTTMWTRLKKRIPSARFVPSLPMTKGLFAEVETIERRDLLLWDAVYDPRQLYVCDRSTFVCGPVYAKVFGRTPPDTERWDRHIRVLYVDTATEVLLDRWDDEFVSFEKIVEIRETYLQMMAKRWQWAHAFDGNLDAAIHHIDRWCGRGTAYLGPDHVES